MLAAYLHTCTVYLSLQAPTTVLDEDGVGGTIVIQGVVGVLDAVSDAWVRVEATSVLVEEGAYETQTTLVLPTSAILLCQVLEEND